MTIASYTQVVNACNILFGPEVVVSKPFIEYLQPSGLKAAYRKKALETHPDRAKTLGIDEAQMLQQFKNVNDAYERLYSIVTGESDFVVNKHATPSASQPYGTQPYERQAETKEFSDDIYSGCLPRQELLIGRFMYYSGLISWHVLIKALVWQRQLYPLMGQIAHDWDLLTLKEIQRILSLKISHEKFGQCAIRKGYLTRFNILALLGKQRTYKKPLGDYFLNKRILSTYEINRAVEQQQLHNRNIMTAKIKQTF